MTDRQELIGRTLRYQAADRKRMAHIDAELSDAANLFRKAAAQLENLLARQACDVQPVLSSVDVEKILKLLAERQRLQRRIAAAHEQLKNLHEGSQA